MPDVVDSSKKALLTPFEERMGSGKDGGGGWEKGKEGDLGWCVKWKIKTKTLKICMLIK